MNKGTIVIFFRWDTEFLDSQRAIEIACHHYRVVDKFMDGIGAGTESEHGYDNGQSDIDPSFPPQQIQRHQGHQNQRNFQFEVSREGNRCDDANERSAEGATEGYHQVESREIL